MSTGYEELDDTETKVQMRRLDIPGSYLLNVTILIFSSILRDLMVFIS